MKTVLDSQFLRQYLSQGKIDAYAADLEAWFEKYDLWHLPGYADHFAIKVEDEIAFHRGVEEIKPYCIEKEGITPGLSIRKMQNRLIATALLKNPLHIRFNPISCIEIMEPRPENKGKDVIGLDHLEFINVDFDGIQKLFNEKEIIYKIDLKNGYKKTIITKINDRQEEVKFTDKTLAQVVPLQLKDKPELVTVVIPESSKSF
jgi:hypothetical protein